MHTLVDGLYMPLRQIHMANNSYIALRALSNDGRRGVLTSSLVYWRLRQGAMFILNCFIMLIYLGMKTEEQQAG